MSSVTTMFKILLVVFAACTSQVLSASLAAPNPLDPFGMQVATKVYTDAWTKYTTDMAAANDAAGKAYNQYTEDATKAWTDYMGKIWPTASSSDAQAALGAMMGQTAPALPQIPNGMPAMPSGMPTMPQGFPAGFPALPQA